MVGTSTPRLQLYKPDPNDNVNVLTDVDANWDKLDLLDKKPSPISVPFIKRNTADSVTSGTDSLFESLTIVLKANHWYEVISDFRYNTTVAVGAGPTATASIRLKAGASVLVSDPQIATSNPFNTVTANPRHSMGETFDVPADGTYTLGLTVNSGGAGNTINILASLGVDNTGHQRCMRVKDLGEK